MSLAPQEQTGIESLETGVRLLLGFVTLGGGSQMLKALAAAAGMPPPKAHRYLVSMVRTGLVERDPRTSQYRLGPAAVQIGASALGSTDAIVLGHEAMLRLRDGLQHTVALSVWGSNGPTIVRVAEAERLPTMTFRVGTTLPLLEAAVGQLFTAFLPEAEVARVMAPGSELLSAPSASVRGGGPRLRLEDPRVKALLADVRRRAMARVRGDMTPGIAAMAAPALDSRGMPAFTLSVVGPQGEFDSRWEGDIGRALRREAAAISMRLGYLAPDAGTAMKSEIRMLRGSRRRAA